MKILKKTKSYLTKPLPSVDLIVLIFVILLGIFGAIMIFSAGSAYAEARYGDGLYFIKRQTVWLLLGLAVAYFSSRINMETYKKITPFLYLFTVILLLLVLLIGFVGNGAKRWISIGPITLQPSEIAKLSMIMMLARYFSNNGERALSDKKKNVLIYGTLIPASIMLLPIILVMLQKHLSCIIILFLIGLCVIVVSGVGLRYISAFCIGGGCALAAIALFTDYTKERITVWLNPEAYKLTGGWQTLQGLMAIGSGGILGNGFGNSVMKHCYVSEPANDMIFSILCEEFGTVGAILTLSLFAALVIRGTVVALRATDVYSRLVAFGICAKLAVQVLLNVAVVTNSIPNTGISLPFFSYGGSSLIMLFFEMGMLLSVSRQSKIIK